MQLSPLLDALFDHFTNVITFSSNLERTGLVAYIDSFLVGDISIKFLFKIQRTRFCIYICGWQI